MTDDTLVAAAEPGSPASHPRTTFGDRVRFVLRGAGQTLITCGLIVLLFVVYEVWVTNWASDRANHRLMTKLDKQWASGQDPLALPGSANRTIPAGTGIANLYIPRLGPDYAWTIVQGSSVPTDAQLAHGPAHYAGTQLPSQVGNFAIAGHRVGKGEPFLNLDRLRPGDNVIVETKTAWYVYQVKGQQHGINKDDSDGIPGRQIVSPSDGQVVLPVPNAPGKAPTEKLMTMTTCNPKFVANNRLIVYAALNPALTVPWTGDTMPAKIKALYDEVHT